jgi:hypothetical protein
MTPDPHLPPSSATDRTIVLAGHCGPDAHMLAAAVRSAVPGARIVMNTDESTLWQANPDLILVNRILDGRYEDEQGLGLIRRAVERGVPAMIISNYADAQAAAVQAGAVPGFGKSEARSDKAAGAIRAALGTQGN